MAERPSVEAVLAVISDATPLLERLEAAKVTLAGYEAAVASYTEAVSTTQAEIDTLVEELQVHADRFVALYVPPETPPE